jgi:hypothetical protein
MKDVKKEEQEAVKKRLTGDGQLAFSLFPEFMRAGQA